MKKVFEKRFLPALSSEGEARNDVKRSNRRVGGKGLKYSVPGGKDAHRGNKTSAMWGGVTVV